MLYDFPTIIVHCVKIKIKYSDIQWPSDDALILFQEYQKFRLLKNRKHKERLYKVKKNDAREEIAKTCSVEIVKEKMSSFRRVKG